MIDHQLTPDTMVYGSVTRGYQAGGFNSVSTQANGGRFDPETITSYELGAKGRIADGRHHATAPRCSTTCSRTCSRSRSCQPTDGSRGSYEITVSDVKATGLDGELNWQVAAPLRLLRERRVDRPEVQGPAPTRAGANDLTGQPYGTPSCRWPAGVDFTLALAGGKADWTLQGSHIGATRCNADSATQGSCLTTPTFRWARRTTASTRAWAGRRPRDRGASR